MDIDHILKDRRRIEKLNKDLQSVLNRYPSLMVFYEKYEAVYIYGTFRLLDDKGFDQGNWEIKIPIPKKYPYEFPQLIETSNKIEATEDRHIDKFGRACTELDIIAEDIARKGITILEFIEKYVSKYFSWQVLYTTDYKGNLDSWAHQIDGKEQFFYEILDTRDKNFVLECINIIRTNSEPKRNDTCFCTSGKKFKRCHQPALEKLEKFGLKNLEGHISQIVEKKELAT